MKQIYMGIKSFLGALKIIVTIFGGTKLENGFRKKNKNLPTCILLKAFCLHTPQSIEHQNKGPKEHDRK